jgi:DNA ligase (NAD+)
MRLSRFEEHYAGTFKNPRNLTAGKLKQKDPEETRKYGLSFFAYDIHGTDLPTEVEKAALLESLGFSQPPIREVSESDDIVAAVHEVAEERAKMDCETDGVVMKADRVSEQTRLGATSHHPRYALAYKFQGETGQTKLVRVEWSVGRSGVVTPVAVVEPVHVGGVTITNITLHNAGFIAKLGLKSDTLLEVERAGDVIPHVKRVLSASGEPIPGPDFEVVEDGDFLYVTDAHVNKDVIKKKIQHFLKVLDIQGFGEKLISFMVDDGHVRTPADVFRLDVPILTSVERVGVKTAESFIAERERKRAVQLPVLLTKRLREAGAEELSALHGIGPRIAESLVDGLREREDEIDDLLGELTILEPEPVEETDHVLFGKSVVFTGKLAKMDRKSAQKLVKEVGGKTPSSVSADLDYLVIGDDGSPLLGEGKKSTKHTKAEKLNDKGADIRIISETDFEGLVRA